MHIILTHNNWDSYKEPGLYLLKIHDSSVTLDMPLSARIDLQRKTRLPDRLGLILGIRAAKM